MTHFDYRDGELHVEDVPAQRIADEVGTPCYVYSRGRIESNWNAYDQAFGDYPHQICYAVKANGLLAILNALAKLGSGFDIVSGGELEKVRKAGGDLSKVVFSGVGKTMEEIETAVASNVGCIDVESVDEIDRVSEVASRIGRRVPLAVRVNPDVNPDTHPYIATGLRTAKFGIGIDQALETYRHAAGLPGIEISGVACHIGSQLMNAEPLLDAFHRLLDLVDVLDDNGIDVRHVDAGGGLGIGHGDAPGPDKTAWIKAMIQASHRRRRQLPILIEPGRSIVGDAGMLLTRVEYLKTNGDKHFAVVDAGMNDLLRPALYQARHNMLTVRRGDGAGRRYDVVGPVCESADVLGTDRELSIETGDLVAIMDTGAYGSVMASNYNARPRPAEVMVDGASFHLARRRESFTDMVALEEPMR